MTRLKKGSSKKGRSNKSSRKGSRSFHEKEQEENKNEVEEKK
jgi:hypothetical protein